jgi:hypothetical protein
MAKAANLAAQCGMWGIRVDTAMQEYATTVAGRDSTGIDALVDACDAHGLGLIAILKPQPANSSSWNTEQGGVPPVSRRPMAAAWPALTTVLQALVDRIHSRWASHGLEDGKLVFQWGNEPGWGGSGAAIGTLGFGTLDGVTSGLQGSTDSRTDTFNSAAAGLGYGTWDSDAEWDALATYTGKPAYGNVRGWHEISQAILPALDLHGHQLLGATSNGLVTAIESTTYAPLAFTYWRSYDVHTCNDYLGQIDGLHDPASYAAAYRSRLAARYAAMTEHLATWTPVKKGLGVLETGVRADWIQIAGRPASEFMRGRYARAVYDAACSVGDWDYAGWYTGLNGSAGEDATGANFGLAYSTGNWAAGVAEFAGALGRSLIPSPAPVPGDPSGSWVVSGANEPGL